MEMGSMEIECEIIEVESGSIYFCKKKQIDILAAIEHQLKKVNHFLENKHTLESHS